MRLQTFGTVQPPNASVNASRRRWLRLAITIAIGARVAVFVFAMFWPIPNERAEPVSPLAPQAYFDFDFYVESLMRYLAWEGVVEQFTKFYDDPTGKAFGPIIAGPVFPLLIGASGFVDGHLLPLALSYLALGSALAVAWLIWLARCPIPGAWLVLFAVLPNPIWYVLVVSPDMLFAGEFAAFYFAYFAATPGTWRRTGVWTSSLVLMLLTRPNALSVALFVVVDSAIMFLRRGRISVRRGIGMALLMSAALLYLLPYFLFEMNKAGTALTYFGHAPQTYVQGIYPLLPGWLDRPLSWLSLLGAKILYFFGLRPSYGVTPTALVWLRGAAGVILLPGLLWLLARGPRREALLVGLFMLPFLLGPAQDRYYLAIYPLLFLYGVKAWTTLASLSLSFVPRAAK